jgi:hypothetical protein
MDKIDILCRLDARTDTPGATGKCLAIADTLGTNASESGPHIVKTTLCEVGNTRSTDIPAH